MLELNEDNFKKEILESNIPSLVVFWRPGCDACSFSLILIKEMEKELNGKAKIGIMNIFENSEIAQKYKIPAVPTLIIFKNGEAKEKAVGMRSKQILIDKINLLV